MFLIIFTCIEINCEMKDNDYENKRMTLRETCYCTSLINENKRN
jgi:hypothetical protein